MKAKTKTIFGYYSMLVLIMFGFAGDIAAAPQSRQLPKTVRAPRVRQLQLVAVKDIMPCEKVIASPHTDSLFILRGTKLFQLSLVKPYRENLIGESNLFAGATLEVAFIQKGLTYILFNYSDKYYPLLYEVGGERILPLAPYGKGNVRLPGVVPKSSGEEIDKLFVNGNGLLYEFRVLSNLSTEQSSWCWIDLTKGGVKKYPGWNFRYTDTAGRIAVFGYYKQSPDFEINTAPFGMDIRTGEAAYRLPNKHKSPYIQDSNLSPRAALLDEKFTSQNVIGVSVRDKSFYRILLPRESTSVEKIEASDDFAALHIRNSGDADEYVDDYSLWVTPLRDRAHPKRVCYDVQDFAMSGAGYCVYSTRLRTEWFNRDTAYVYNYSKHETWNLLDGIEPEIPQGLRQFLVDTEAFVDIESGFGRAINGRWAFVEVGQLHYDRREIGPLTGSLPVRYKLWKHFLVSSQGNRYEVKIPKKPRDIVLVHHQGTVVLLSANWSDSGFNLKLFRFNPHEERSN